MRIAIYLIASFFFFAFQVHSQSLDIIFNIKDRQGPLPGATVRIFDVSKTQVLNGAQTDDLGILKIRVDVSKARYAEIRMLGYRTEWITLNKSTSYTIELREESYSLPNVVVTASKTEQRIEETTVSLTVIRPNLVENKNPTDVQQTMNQVPGVNVNDGQANIRSGSGWSYGAGTRVLLLLDNLPLISPDANQVQWTIVPFESLEQLEVIKGASSALYGSSALNGVINVRTRSDYRKRSWLNVFTGGYPLAHRSELKWWNGAQTLGGVQMSLQNRRENPNDENRWFGYLVSGLGQWDEGYQWRSPDNRSRLFFKTHWNRSKNLQYGVNGNISYRKSASPLIWNGENQALIAQDSSITTAQGFTYHIDPWLTINNFRKTGVFRHEINGRFLAIDNNSRDDSTVYDNASKSYLAQYQLQWLSYTGLKITGGFFGLWSESNSELFVGRHTSRNLATYLQTDYKWNRLSLSAGARFESFMLDDRQQSKPVLRFGANYKVAPYTNLYASWGQGFRFPSMAEAFTQTNVGAVNIFPNPKLNPEFGNTYEIGAKQLLAVGQKLKMQAELALFRMDFDDMIEFTFSRWDTVGGLAELQRQLGFKSVNVGAVRIQGVELTFTGLYESNNHKFEFLAGYAFSDPRVRYPDRPFIFNEVTSQYLTYQSLSTDDSTGTLKYRYRHLLKTDVQWTHIRGYRAGISLRYNDYMRNLDRVFYQVIPGVQSVHQRLNRGDLVIDLRIGYKWPSGAMVNLIIDNALNREIMIRPAFLAPPMRVMLQYQVMIDR
ncbi:MAG: TonB-dependent receptor [Thermaurantimonas sp.]|uniref:TonB-dependent receptor n=1 Tax=Thermaurantimonas sp. TaxID=2681568 RepID=UPI00391AF662